MTIKLRVIQGRPAGKWLTFPRGDYFFGRGLECQVRPNSDWVSRQHCLLRVRPEGAYLRDLGSTNGTLVNGELIHKERRLENGDQIEVGPLVFEVLLQSATPASGVRTAPRAEGSPAEGSPHEGGPSLDTTEHHPIVPKEL